MIGIWGAIGLVATAFASSYVYENRPLNLYLINAGYHVVTIPLMAGHPERLELGGERHPQPRIAVRASSNPLPPRKMGPDGSYPVQKTSRTPRHSRESGNPGPN